MFEALPMGNSWHDAQVLDAWDYVETPHGKSSRPVAWLCMTKFDRELWETRSGWRLLDEKWRLALGRLWHAWCWHFAPDIIQGSCAKRARKRAKRAQKGAKRARKKSVPLDPLVLTVMTCRVFLKTLFTHGPNSRHGPKRRRRHVVLSLWGACCFSLSLASSSIAPFSSWNGSCLFYLDSRCACFWILPRSVHLKYVMLLFVVTVVFLCWVLNVERPAWGFFVWNNNTRLLMWCCENCAIAEGCLLEVSWPMKNIRDVEVDTLDLPCPKLGCLHVLRCNPCCQVWLFEVVFGMLHMH